MRQAAVFAIAVVLASEAWAGLGEDSELKANVDQRLNRTSRFRTSRW